MDLNVKKLPQQVVKAVAERDKVQSTPNELLRRQLGVCVSAAEVAEVAGMEYKEREEKIVCKNCTPSHGQQQDYPLVEIPSQMTICHVPTTST